MTAAPFRLPRPIALLMTGIFMAFILFTSTKPSPKVEGFNQSAIDHILDYAHLPIYALLTFLLLLAFCSFDYRRQAAAFVIAGLFGVLNEVIQLSVPGRSCSLHDVIMNTCGAILTIASVNFFLGRQRIIKP